MCVETPLNREERPSPETLRLDRLQLTEIVLPLKHPFETSFGKMEQRRTLVVKVLDKGGAAGYGECVALEHPLYTHETVDTAWIIIAKHLAPLLARSHVTSASGVPDAFAAIRGNYMARGAVEAAIWDLEARLCGKPLWRHIGGTRNEIVCGVSIGIQPTLKILLDKIAAEVSSGYQRIKIKIKPGKDVDLLKEIRQQFPEIALSVDANSAYLLDRDLPTLQRLDEFNLMMMEQPLQPGDLLDHSKLQRQISTPLCLDESISTLTDAQQSHELGACKIINIKLGRVGGHAEARKIQEFALANGIPVWCGGMLESGIGRAHNIALSTLPGFTLPGDVSASSRYWEEDIIDPEVTVSAKGTIKVPPGAGIGFKIDEHKIARMAVRQLDVPLV
jgi:O-succinylbenzoate synthase